ncbi:unnamed protein product [Caenorhabditis bovis]|uniref:Uncharacterized protein n=1 Tax=Caenorhabditis bovis TaxID=2654633 RepID=A0A8S1F894_9PELO|nr:unnamed protein product [Caenorhabditis bovis]
MKRINTRDVLSDLRKSSKKFKDDVEHEVEVDMTSVQDQEYESDNDEDELESPTADEVYNDEPMKNDLSSLSNQDLMRLDFLNMCTNSKAGAIYLGSRDPNAKIHDRIVKWAEIALKQNMDDGYCGKIVAGTHDDPAKRLVYKLKSPSSRGACFYCINQSTLVKINDKTTISK